MFNAETVAFLVEFYKPGEIRAFWKQVGEALMSRSQTIVQVTSSSFEGGSATGMALNTPAEQQSFMSACREALRQLEGTTTVDPATLGTPVDFSRRMVAV